MTENFSTQTENSEKESGLGEVVGQEVCCGRSSEDMYTISTCSRSRVFLATLGGRTAAGLYRPLPGVRAEKAK